MIVEDDVIYSSFLEEKIKPQIDQVTVVHTAEAGAGVVSTLKPDIVFMDNVLPKLNGVEVIELYKEAHPEVKIILISGSYVVEDIAKAIQSGADYVIKKSGKEGEEIDQIIAALIESKKSKSKFWSLIESFRSPEKGSHKKSIAVVEDDELFSFHLSWNLEQTGNNHLVYTFSSAEEFFKFCDVTLPDIVFLDYSLPDQNGDKVLDRINTFKEKPEVVVISSVEDEGVALDLNKKGITNYIVKNKNWKERLNNTIEKLGL